MLSTVLAQVGMPRVLARFGYRAVLAAGLLLLGIPAFLYVPLGEVPAILAVTLVRGAGFGAAIVALAALATKLAPPGRRGEALGLYGVALTLPTIFCGALDLGALWFRPRLPDRVPLAPPRLFRRPRDTFAAKPGRKRGRGPSNTLRTALAPAPLLPLRLLHGRLGRRCDFPAPLGARARALLRRDGPAAPRHSATFFRWWAGRLGDHRNLRVLLVPGLLCAALGMAALSLEGLALLGGALLFGAGFGALQNTTLLLTMERVPNGEYGLGSTLWNIAFDAGTGAGAFVFGFVVGAAGFSWAYALCAVLLVVTIGLVPGIRGGKIP
jgi:MFS family permease